MTRSLLVVPIALSLALITAPDAADAQRRKRKKKGTPACGISYLPLVKGNQWTFEPMEAPLPPGKKKQPKRPPATVKSPDKITIKVMKVAKGKGKKPTVVTLEETIDKFTRTTTVSCTATRLDVSPQSFFFTAGPGGGYKMTLAAIKRTGTPFPGKKGFKRGKWSESITADVTREPLGKVNHPKASITIEREVTVEGREMIGVAAGQFNAWRVRIDVSGRAKLASNPQKPVEIGTGRVGVLWIYPKVGVVRARDSAGRWYQLTGKTLN